MSSVKSASRTVDFTKADYAWAPLATLPPELRPIDATWHDRFCRAARRQTFEKGAILASANQELPDLIFIQSGWVSLSTDQQVTGFMGAGAVYLASGVLDAHVPASTVQALTPLSAVLLERKLIGRMFLENSSILLAALDQAVLLLSRLRVTYARRSISPLVSRLAHLLWTLSDDAGDGRRKVTTDISQSVLGSFLGCAREEVNRKRQILMKAGHVSKTGKYLYLEPSLAQMLKDEGFPLFFWART